MALLSIAFVFVLLKLASMAHTKGRSRIWALVGVLLLGFAQLVGAVIDALVFGVGSGIYVFVFTCSGLGLAAAFVLVHNLAPGGSLAAPGDPYDYAHADPSNPFSPPGHGTRP